MSTNFDVKRILTKILESITKKVCRMDNLDSILQILQFKMKKKKYLLILDDVWNTDYSKWNRLKYCLFLINTNTGNKIMVTTCSNVVASVMELQFKHHLEKLSEDDCWSIFKGRAFADDGASITEEFFAIGKDIVKKCGGVPLATKVLGCLMRSEKAKNEWLEIQNSEIWNLPDDEIEILPVLKLSFDHLSSPFLKKCFANCSILPKDFKIEKENLVQVWMAQGFLESQGWRI